MSKKKTAKYDKDLDPLYPFMQGVREAIGLILLWGFIAGVVLTGAGYGMYRLIKYIW